jgi:hypothetical protein
MHCRWTLPSHRRMRLMIHVFISRERQSARATEVHWRCATENTWAKAARSSISRTCRHLLRGNICWSSWSTLKPLHEKTSASCANPFSLLVAIIATETCGMRLVGSSLFSTNVSSCFRSSAALTRHTLRPGDIRQGFLAVYSWSLTQSLFQCASVRLQPGLRGVADGS